MIIATPYKPAKNVSIPAFSEVEVTALIPDQNVRISIEGEKARITVRDTKTGKTEEVDCSPLQAAIISGLMIVGEDAQFELIAAQHGVYDLMDEFHQECRPIP